MRIVYCLHSLHRSGGIERVLSIKANYLAETSGHDVHIVAACLKGRKPHFPLSDKITVHDLGINDNLPWSGYSSKLSRTLLEINPDVCIAVGDTSMKALLKSSDRSAKVAEFHFSHEKYLMKYGTNPLTRLYAQYRTKALEKLASKFDKFVVLTEADQKDWQRAISNVTYIYNPQTFVSESAAPLSNKCCIAAGRLERQKNFKDAVKAWKTVAEKHPDWTLDIYGAGSLEKELKSQIEELSLEGKVRLMGLSNNIRQQMLSSSMLLMTSIFEGFPMVLLEAAEVGLPAISYDCPKGPSDIIDNGKTGYIITPGDTEALAQAVCKIIEDENLRYTLGKAAREKAEMFRIDKTMALWNDLFEELTRA